MTLGGLALAVGILVDDATVTIENINWHLEQGKDVDTAILDGARQIVVPAFVSLLCICIVFVPMFGLGGVARLSVRAAGRGGGLRADRLLSSCPARWCRRWRNFLLRQPRTSRHGAGMPAPRNPLVRFQHGFEHGFDRYPRSATAACSVWRSANAARSSSASWPSSLLASAWRPMLGQNFFPSVDAGQIKLHVRAQTGTRIEETARALRPGRAARSAQIIPPRELGRHRRQYRPAGQRHQHRLRQLRDHRAGGRRYHDHAQAGPPPDRRLCPSAARAICRALFPGTSFAFLPADIVTQILNFGLPAPIDVQVIGTDQRRQPRLCRQAAAGASARCPASPSCASSRRSTQPTLNVNVDRSLAD